MYFLNIVPPQELALEQRGQSPPVYKTLQLHTSLLRLHPVSGIRWQHAVTAVFPSEVSVSNPAPFFSNLHVHGCGTVKAMKGNMSFCYLPHSYYPKIWFKQVLRHTNPLLILYLFIPTRNSQNHTLKIRLSFTKKNLLCFLGYISPKGQKH